MGSQRGRHDWATKLSWTFLRSKPKCKDSGSKDSGLFFPESSLIPGKGPDVGTHIRGPPLTPTSNHGWMPVPALSRTHPSTQALVQIPFKDSPGFVPPRVGVETVCSTGHTAEQGSHPCGLQRETVYVGCDVHSPRRSRGGKVTMGMGWRLAAPHLQGSFWYFKESNHSKSESNFPRSLWKLICQERRLKHLLFYNLLMWLTTFYKFLYLDIGYTSLQRRQ